MSKKFYPNQQPSAGPRAERPQLRFDASLDADSWVPFIINLRLNAGTLFGAAAETVQTERRLIFFCNKKPNLPLQQLKLWNESTDGDMHKNHVKLIMQTVSEYEVAMAKTCDLLLTEKFMCPDIRARVTQHPLFVYVVQDLEPPEHLRSLYAIDKTDCHTMLPGMTWAHANEEYLQAPDALEPDELNIHPSQRARQRPQRLSYDLEEQVDEIMTDTIAAEATANATAAATITGLTTPMMTAAAAAISAADPSLADMRPHTSMRESTTTPPTPGVRTRSAYTTLIQTKQQLEANVRITHTQVVTGQRT